MVDKELIEIWRNELKPAISLLLLNINYEEVGEQDKEEFERDFDEILNIALVGLKYKAQLPQERTAERTESHACDLISRQAAIDALNHEYRCGDIISQCGIEVAIDIISELPTIQPEPKEGHWIQYDKRFPWRLHYKCSECGNYLDFSGVNAGRGSANFCPNCGAKMKGEMI